jgi:hypothetical protein
MSTSSSWRRWAAPAACLALLACGGSGFPQQPPGVAPPGPGVGPSAPTPPPQPTIDQLIDRLEQIRKQKAELDRQEQAVVAELRAALKRQRERLAKLGVEEAPPPRPSEPGVSPPDLPKVPPR